MSHEKIKSQPKNNLNGLVQTVLSITCPKTGKECSLHYCQYEGCQYSGDVVIPSIPNPLPKPQEVRNSLCECGRQDDDCVYPLCPAGNN